MEKSKKQIVTIKQMPTNRTASINLYFNDVKKYRLLNSQEEVDLIVAYKNGDARAGEKIITANLRFVISVAKQFINTGVPLADLISAGNIGLMHAVERFDHSLKFKFISYAVWWIRQSILQEITNHSRPIKLPANIHQKNMRHRRMFGEDLPEIAQLHVRSYNHKIGDDGMEYLDLLVDDGSFDAPDSVEFGEINLHKIINRLTPRERDIIRLRYGIGVPNEHSYDDIIKELDLDLTKERVRQIHFAALRKLKWYSKHVKKESLLGG
jgi:RNA polymerase primary sigma factor